MPTSMALKLTVKMLGEAIAQQTSACKLDVCRQPAATKAAATAIATPSPQAVMASTPHV